MLRRRCRSRQGWRSSPLSFSRRPPAAAAAAAVQLLLLALLHLLLPVAEGAPVPLLWAAGEGVGGAGDDEGAPGNSSSPENWGGNASATASPLSTSPANGTSPSSSSSDGSGSESGGSARPPLEVVRDVVLIFLAGIGIVVALMVFTYTLTVLVDKARSLLGLDHIRPLSSSSFFASGSASSGDSDDSNPGARIPAAEVAGGALLHEAGLRGITPDELRKLLCHVLQPTPFETEIGGVGLGDDRTPIPPVSKAPAAPTPAMLSPSCSPAERDAAAAQSILPSSSSSSSSLTTPRPTDDSDNGVPNAPDQAPPRPGFDVEVGLPLPDESAPEDDGAAASDAAPPAGNDGPVTPRAATAGGGSSPRLLLRRDSSFDDDHRRTCCICLNRYASGDILLVSRNCPHRYHYDCCLEWLDRNHRTHQPPNGTSDSRYGGTTGCPYCRAPLVQADELRAAAWEVLGPARVVELKQGGRRGGGSTGAAITATVTPSPLLPPLTDQRMFPSPRTSPRGGGSGRDGGGASRSGGRTEPGTADLLVVHL